MTTAPEPESEHARRVRERMVLGRRVRSLQYHIDHGKACCPVCDALISNGLPMVTHLRTHVREHKLIEQPYEVELSGKRTVCYGYYTPASGSFVTFVSFQRDGGSGPGDRSFEYASEIMQMHIRINELQA